MKVALLAPLLAATLGACFGGERAHVHEPLSTQEYATVWDALAPDAILALIERRLSEDPVVVCDFEVESEGAIVSDFTGTLRFERDRTLLVATGTFAGNAVDLRLEAADGRMTGHTGGGVLDAEEPVALREGLALGLVRMGLLHNLAVLSGGGLPDGTDGGARDWIVAHDVSRRIDHGPGTGRRNALEFELEVAGQRRADVTLFLDLLTATPVERHQTVRFDTGTMSVVERYSFAVR